MKIGSSAQQWGTCGSFRCMSIIYAKGFTVVGCPHKRGYAKKKATTRQCGNAITTKKHV